MAGIVSAPAGMLLDRSGGRLGMGAGSLLCALASLLFHLMAIRTEVAATVPQPT